MSSPSAYRFIDRNSPVPYYEQLRQVLLQLVEDDGLRPGDLLPSEAELCETYGVSRTVVRQAVGELVNEGRLRRERGKGTFVAEPKLHEQFVQSTGGFFDDFTSRGHAVGSRVVRLDMGTPPEAGAKALGLSTDGAACVELSRVRSVNGELIAYTESYLPSTLLRDLLGRLRASDLENQSLYQVLSTAGVSIATGTRSVEAVGATRRLADLLDVQQGAPVLYMESVVYDEGRRPVEYFEAWHRGDRTRLDFTVGGAASIE